MKLETLQSWHEKINRDIFDGKLSDVIITRTRNTRLFGSYITPERDPIYDYAPIIEIADWVEPNAEVPTIAHEMIHQYQEQILDWDMDEISDNEAHGEMFEMWAVKIQQFYGWDVRP